MDTLQLQITNTRNLFFGNNKQSYLKFRDNWANYEGYLNSDHFMLYVLLRGRDPYGCFNPIVSETILRQMDGAYPTDPYKALKSSLRSIMSTIRSEQNIISNDDKLHTTYGEQLLAPFGGIITKEHLYIVGEKITESIS